MKTKKMIIISNVIVAIKLALYTSSMVLSFVTAVVVGGLLGDSIQIVENAGEHDLTGGYEAAVGMVGGLLSGMLAVVLIFLGVILFVIMIIYILSLIHGIVVYNKAFKLKYKPLKNRVKALKRDSIQKLVVASLELIGVLFLCVSNEVEILFVILGCFNIAYIVFLSYTIKTIASEKLELETYVRA